MHLRSKNHRFTTNQPAYYTNSTFIVLIVSPRLVQIVFTSSSHGHYKGLPSMNNIFTHMSFFLVSLFHFHCTLYRGLAGACVNPQAHDKAHVFLFLYAHALVCPITHSFLNGFQPNLVQHFPYVYSTSHSIFSLNKTLECVCDT